MDLTAVAGMVFVLLVLALIAGFILIFPVVRRITPLLEQRIQGKRGEALASVEIRELREAVQALEREVRTLVERQSFEHAVLERPRTAALPAESEPPA